MCSIGCPNSNPAQRKRRRGGSKEEVRAEKRGMVTLTGSYVTTTVRPEVRASYLRLSVLTVRVHAACANKNKNKVSNMIQDEAELKAFNIHINTSKLPHRTFAIN